MNSSASQTSAVAEQRARRLRSWAHRHRKALWTTGAILLIALVTAGFFAEKYWPYRYRNVKPLLEQVFASHITVSGYHRIYFPHPGFVADQLTLRRNSAPDLPPVGSTQKLIVQGSWWDLLTLHRRVMLVDVVGLHVVIPPAGTKANHEDFPAGSSGDFTGPETPVEQLHIHKAALDVMRTNGSRYTYVIHDAVIRNLKKGEAISYSIDMENASPVGRVVARGSFGPLAPKNLGATPLRGTFTFGPVKLNQIGELRGILSAKGQFHGTLTAVTGEATADTPDFAVSEGRRVPVSGWVRYTVNGLNADVVLNQIVLHTGKSTVEAGGSMRGSPKVADLDITVTKGRPQDLLQPFLKDESPIVGVVWLKAHAHLAPYADGVSFFQRLTMEGSFNVPQERLTSYSKQKTLTDFSQRAQGKDADDKGAGNKASGNDKGSGNKGTANKGPGNEEQGSGAADVVSSLKGPVKIADGVARTPRLTFDLPGASADVHGWYDLRDGRVHMDGTLKMKSDISHATTGWKSILMKPLAPIFKKKKAGAAIPIAVTGRPYHYHVTSNILHQK